VNIKSVGTLLASKKAFLSYHLTLQPLFITKNHQHYLNRDNFLASLQSQLDKKQGISHKPTLSQRSQQLAKAQSKDHIDKRLIEHGKIYETAKKKK
jgi:hypothetical protein